MRLSILRLVVRAMVEVSTYFRWRVAWVIPQLHHVGRRVVGITYHWVTVRQTLGGALPPS